MRNIPQQHIPQDLRIGHIITHQTTEPQPQPYLLPPQGPQGPQGPEKPRPKPPYDVVTVAIVWLIAGLANIFSLWFTTPEAREAGKEMVEKYYPNQVTFDANHYGASNTIATIIFIVLTLLILRAYLAGKKFALVILTICGIFGIIQILGIFQGSTTLPYLALITICAVFSAGAILVQYRSPVVRSYFGLKGSRDT